MKRLITLILMVTTIITLTQKVMVVSPLLESEMQSIQSMQHCNRTEMLNDSACLEASSDMEHCQNNCEMMSVVSVLHFIEHQQLLSFDVSVLRYERLDISPSYSVFEALYRPPFVS
jgi:hypothetical protein